MAATTVLSVGSVTITANGGTTGTLLAQVTTALAGLTGTQIVTVGSSDATIPTVPATGGPYELIINPGYTGSLNIPTGYTYVINGTTGDVTGGSSSSVIIGNNLNYSGGAGSLIATGTGGSISDNTGGAEIAIASGDYTVNASGGNDTVAFDSGSTSQATVSGANSEIIVGGTTITSGPFAAGTSTVSSVDTIDITPTSPGTDTILAQTGGAANLIASAPVSVDATGGAITVELVPSTSAALTLTATGGSQLIFDNVGKSIVNAGPSTQYIEADNVSGVSTITSSTGGEDTVYALSSADYVATLASASEFIGSANGAVTVDAAQNATLFGGASGGTYNLGSDSAGFFFLWGHVWNGPGGVAASVVSNDTVIGGAGSPTVSIWGNSNENVVVSQQGSAAFNAGGTYVAYGNDDTINATAATGGDNFVVWNASITGLGDFSGNTTLLGATSGNENFALFSYLTAGGTATNIAAGGSHTIDIQNWTTTDQLFMGQYGSADVEGLYQAQQAAGGGSFNYTLSDGTSVQFTGNSSGGLIYGNQWNPYTNSV